MNRHVNAIAGRLSLRKPQRESLEILDRVTEIVPPQKDTDLAAALAAIRSEYPRVTDFEREFPSLCFALATGVGKTRLMGAFIAYLHLAHGLNNFFVLAPNLTIYNKLIRDFTPNTDKYVFKGISEFAIDSPVIVTGDNYAQVRDTRSGLFPELAKRVQINIFNISKITSEVRGGKAPRIKRLSEYLGESYFEHLAALPDLVLLMDESHHYRASAGMRAINELKPVLGLELTATPLVETSKGPIRFKNVILDYPLGQAMVDEFVKDPAVVTRKDFSPVGMTSDELEQMKLDDGIRLHESVKVELATYARETGRQKPVKPFVLVIARDTTHAGQLLRRIESDDFFGGAYAGKVIQVDSSRTGVEEEAMVERLLKVEDPDEPTEIVIHVNMLKEGWDVTNLYTIIPLRAANARILIEQSIGRGLRLPYGKRTGVAAVDRLNIVAHDKFQEIVDEANRPGSVIKLKKVYLDQDVLAGKTVTVVSQSQLASKLGFGDASDRVSGSAAPLFTTPAATAVARIAYDAIRKLETQPEGIAYVSRPEVRAKIVDEVRSQYVPLSLEYEEPPDFAVIVAQTADTVVQQTISIPRIQVVPRGEVRTGFRPFNLDTSALRYQAPSDDLYSQSLHDGKRHTLSVQSGGHEEARLEDYIVGGLIDFDDISYDDHAELLYDLAKQVVRHFESYLGEDEVPRVLSVHRRQIASFVHAQMLAHYWESAIDYDVIVSRGFTELKPSAYTIAAADQPLNFRHAPTDKSNMARYLFTGFSRCLYALQKFQSDPERIMAIILDHDSERWFKPAKGQFQLFYKWGADHPEYQPDFVAETPNGIFMIEPKAANQMDDPEVLAKRDVAVKWCANAGNHALQFGGKPWTYLLIPHTVLAENMTLTGLAQRYAEK